MSEKSSKSKTIPSGDPFDPPSDPTTDGGKADDGNTLIDGSTLPTTVGDLQTDVGKKAKREAGEHPPQGPLPLQRALREVEASIDTELVGSLEKLEVLRKKEEGLQEQLEQLYLELGNVQDALVENSGTMRAAMGLRTGISVRRFDMQATAVQRTLLTDAADLRQRERLWKSRLDEAEARVRAFKENPKLADQIEEFRRLDERMDTLELIPESYRGVLLAHHSDLQDKLKPHLEEPSYDEPPSLRLAVAVGLSAGRRLDAPDSDKDSDTARLLAVLPVDFKTYSRARQGKADLTSRFAFRVLAALSRFVVNIGARSDPKPHDLDGLLGIELPFNDLDIPVASVDLARALRESFADATDSQMAKIKVSTDMVFVAFESLEALWKRAAEEKAPSSAKTPPRKSKGRAAGRAGK
jgi:hypothetical protein